MPINANIPLSVHSIKSTDYITPAKNALAMQGMQQSQRLAAENALNAKEDRLRNITKDQLTLSQKALDATGTAMRNAFENNYSTTKDNNAATAAAHQAGRTVFNQRQSNIARMYPLYKPPTYEASLPAIGAYLHHKQTEFEQKQALQKQKNAAAMKRAELKAAEKANATKTTVTADADGNPVAIITSAKGAKRVPVEGINDVQEAQTIADKAQKMADAWVNEQGGWWSTAEDFADYGGNKEQARADKTVEFIKKFSAEANAMKQNSETPPMEGAKKANDGKWYVQKGDQWFRVNP